jgi:hypothetical protein
MCLCIFFSEPLPTIPQSDEKILMECDTANDCPVPELSNCNIMLRPSSSGKRGYCVPSLCQSDGNCPKLGDECTSGSLTGTCNPRNTCEYNQLLAIAICGKELIKKSIFFQKVTVHEDPKFPS